MDYLENQLKNSFILPPGASMQTQNSQQLQISGSAAGGSSMSEERSNKSNPNENV
jgi:hypothetical protein